MDPNAENLAIKYFPHIELLNARILNCLHAFGAVASSKSFHSSRAMDEQGSFPCFSPMGSGGCRYIRLTQSLPIAGHLGQLTDCFTLIVSALTSPHANTT